MDHPTHRQNRKQNTAKLGNKIPPKSETKYRQNRKQNTAKIGKSITFVLVNQFTMNKLGYL
jgi:hypothetical protein